MKKFINPINIFIMVCVCFVAVGSYFVGVNSVKPIEKEVVKYVELIPQQKFDTTILEAWEGDFSNGQIRMIGAWYYGTDRNGAPIVIDELNELWTLTGYEVTEEDFLLLWVADGNTPDNVHDDIVLKIWVERYEKIAYEEVG